MSFKKSFLSITLALAAVGGLSVLASQPAEAHGINFRQHKQDGRIFQGVRNGQLTRHEAKGLIAQQRHFRHVENRYRVDGHLSPGERYRLDKMQYRSNRSIYNQKHDGQYR